MDNWSRLLAFLKEEEEDPLTPDIEGSASIRPPAPYDKHLSPNLTPLRTKTFDTLANVLVEDAEAKINRMQEALKAPPPNQLFPWQLPKPTKVKAELGVTHWYVTRAQLWCQIAAALGLHNGNWNWSMLSFTMNIRPHYALPDGALVVDDDAVLNKMTTRFPNSIDDEQRAVWKMLRERTTRNTIASWEFKSLLAGNEEVMKSIVRVIRLGSFRWTFCDGNECEKHKEEFPHVGCDASNLAAGLPTNDMDSDDSNGSYYEDAPEKKAQDIIQQVWAQGCIKDLTYFVIHSGNFELICIRHRGSRTLSCSDLVQRCENKYPYGLLQVGIYLAAIDDAIKRCNEADTSGGGSSDSGGGGGVGDTGDNGSASGDRRGEPSGDGAGSGAHDGAGGDPTASAGPGTQPRRSAHIRPRTGAMAPLGLEDEVICIDNAIKSGAKVFVRLKYSVYDSVCPWVFHRVDLHRPSMCLESRHPENPFSVILTSEISSDKGTVVHGGVITVNTENGTVSRPIILKVGFNQDKSLIEGEYNIYKHLQHNGVPTVKVHGLFQDHDGAAAILMDHAGTRIDQVPGGLSKAQQMSFCKLLEQIHNAGVLHNDIATRNLLLSDTGEPVVLDFGNAIVVERKERKAFKGEIEQLHRVLGQHASEKGPHS